MKPSALSRAWSNSLPMLRTDSWRNAELALERVDLFAPHLPVALGKLGRQHDDADREELVAAVEHRSEAGRVPAGLLAELGTQIGYRTGVRRMPERSTDDRSHGAAHGETRHAADNLAPVAHC